MDDDPGKIKIIPDYFRGTQAENVSSCGRVSSASDPKLDSSGRSSCLSRSRKNFKSASFMLNLLNLKGLSWGSSSDGQEKVELSVAELQSLRSQLADLEEREAPLTLEHVDEILRSSHLSGYLYVRTRWAALPGEPPPIDDGDVDDWLPRFVVLHGSCIFFYLLCTDISPQDSTLLSDLVEVEPLPSFTREDETYHAFSIMTRQGLRYECSCASDIQVKSWLTELQGQCKSRPRLPNGSSEHM
ncbi:hypothetical protein MLD38_018526 [Melastoma candidum]|uniref:Uncharacterized protein n=1 Tax=Melastoma candidum TaxID=119954 RepID=A0ACB9QU49_9MYRT|nr:hypothetical protein MLD38_018526 [Melastoma candidum]